MEDINKEPYHIFWKKATNTLEDMLKNPLKYNNNDLLLNLPDDESPFKALPTPSPMRLKSSSLDTSYKTYNPRITMLIEKAKRFECISDQRRLFRTPKCMQRPKNFENSAIVREDFAVSGRKARISLALPKSKFKYADPIDLNAQLKEFISKVQDKYANLTKALDFKNDTLCFEILIEYLIKSSIMVIRPTYTRDKQRVYSQSPSIRKRFDLPARYEECQSPRISEKILLLTVLHR